jgi:hypothetical protein
MISEELVLITSRFDAALERITREVEQKSTRMRRSFEGAGTKKSGMLDGLTGGMTGMGTGLLGAAGLGGGVAGMAMTIKSTLDAAGDLGDLAAKLQDSTEALQRVDFAAKLSGMSGVEEMGNAMIKLERALGDVENTKAREALENLGLSVQELAGMSLDQKILALSDAFAKARAEGTGVADIQALMGKSASELIPLLEQGGDALRGMFEDAPVMAEETVQQLARMGDEIDKFLINSKIGFGSLLGAWAGANEFAAGFIANMMGGSSMGDAWNEALAQQADKEFEDQLNASEREEKRKQTAKAQQDAADRAAAAAAEKAEADAADKAEEDILKRRQEAERERERLEKEAAEEKQRYRDARFETLTPEQQMGVLFERMTRALGQELTDPAKVLGAADAMAALGDRAGALEVLGLLGQIQRIGATMPGAGREVISHGEKSATAMMMDEIFGRQRDELFEVVANTQKSAVTLDQIKTLMTQPPPTDVFDDV